jgi:NADPH:quinone reductase-like Zn-dependent oxidoreductase
MAGEVVEVGPSVTRFRPGDRVLGPGRGWEQPINNPAEGAFQNFAVLREDAVTSLPP